MEEAQYRCTSVEFAEWVERWTYKPPARAPSKGSLKAALQKGGVQFVKA